MSQNKKIVDYFGGCHGKFLELVINGWIEKVPFDKTLTFFNDIGSCHLRANDYKPEFESFHWSYYDLPMHQDAVFVRVRVSQSNMLVAATNSFCRAGDVGLDLYHLDEDTMDKLSHPKHRPMLEDLIKEHGASSAYPRSLLRKRFFCMLDQKELGQKHYDSFKDAEISWDFPFSSFFDKQEFYVELEKLAKWLEKDFFPDQDLDRIYADFIDRNQGYRSYVYCERLITKIKTGINESVHTNILEEAYVIKRLGDLQLLDPSWTLMRDRFETTMDFHQ
jgi:hypothetical protein